MTDEEIELVYIDNGLNKICLCLSTFSIEQQIKIECYDIEDKLIDTKIVEPLTNNLIVTFDNIYRPGFYNFILSIGSLKKVYKYHVSSLSMDEIMPFIVTKNFLDKYRKYYQNTYCLREVIVALSKAIDKTLENCNAISALIKHYNTISRYQNNYQVDISYRKSILELKVDNGDDYFVNIESDCEKFLDLEFNDEGIISLDLPTGLYKIYVYQSEGNLVQMYYYESFSDAINNIVYPEKIKNVEIDIPSDIEYYVGAESGYNGTKAEQKILAAIDCYSILNPLLPIPKLEIVDEDNLKISFGEETEKEVYNKIADIISTGQDIYIYFSELDSLFNSDYTSYRRIKLITADNFQYNIPDQYLDVYSGYLSNNFRYELNFNDERYFYWLGTEKNIRLSDTGTIDFNDDDINYNLIYSEIKLRRNTPNYLITTNNLSSGDKSRKAINNLLTKNYLSYEDWTTLYQNSLLTEKELRYNGEYINLIKYIEGMTAKSAKKFDHGIIEKLVVKYNYKEVELTLKEGYENYIINYKKYDLKTPTSTEDYFKADKTNTFKALTDSVITIKLINTDDYTTSRYIMIYSYDTRNTMKVYTNGLEKENIYGL